MNKPAPAVLLPVFGAIDILKILIISLTTLDSFSSLGAKSKSKAKDLKLTPSKSSSIFGFITLPVALEINPCGVVFPPNEFTSAEVNDCLIASCAPPLINTSRPAPRTLLSNSPTPPTIFLDSRTLLIWSAPKRAREFKLSSPQLT